MDKPRKSPRARAGKKSRQKDEVVSTVKRMLAVPINEKLSLQKEHRITKALTEKKEEQEKMNAEILPRRKKIKELEGEIETLRSQVTKGTEEREVVCEVVKDYVHLKIQVRRRDTREVIEDRTMTAEDRQEDLYKGEGKRATAAPEENDPGNEDEDPGETEADDDEPEVH